MNLLELLKRALEWEDEYDDMPDYGFICERFGINPFDDRDTIRASLEDQLNMLELEGDLAGTEFDAAGEEGVSR